MPGLEDIPKATAPCDASIEQPIEPDEQPAVRELTQTDRINRHLLKSFLERINTAGLQQNFQNINNEGDEATSNSDSFDD